MTTPEQLARLQARALENPIEEPAFFQALLTAILYVHLPLSDDSGKVRLICFTRPDGITVIPVFSDDVKAQAAAQGAARVVSVVGRELFESAPGATWMLDPNDVSCTLYPEEVATLLRDGCMPIVQKHAAADPVAVTAAVPEDEWIAKAAVSALAPMQAVAEIYVTEIVREEPAPERGLLIVLAVDDRHAEQAARAVGVALVACPQTPRLPVDVTTFAPGGMPPWLSGAQVVPLWRRGMEPAEGFSG